tara:strand:+ start:742 stop:1008 length:267 start_codon:yes stop_codon:yes gene_type:complete
MFGAGGTKASVYRTEDIIVSIGSNYHNKEIIESQFIYTEKQFKEISKALDIFVQTARHRGLDGVVNITIKQSSDEYFWVFADLVKFKQ